MESVLYEGWVQHRRHAPAPHDFRYRMFMAYLDLDELPEVLDASLFWSARRPALAWFRRADFLGDPKRPLADCVRELLAAAGVQSTGPIRLLTHLRYFGYSFNPVSFYYCFDEAGRKVRSIVANITNTPWRQRHSYVLTPAMDRGADGFHRYEMAKEFHVSPFFPLTQTYRWNFRDPGEVCQVHMQNLEQGKLVFDATLRLEREAITARSLNRMLLRYPAMTAKVVAGIYWNALLLKRKGATFHENPSENGLAEAKHHG